MRPFATARPLNSELIFHVISLTFILLAMLFFPLSSANAQTAFPAKWANEFPLLSHTQTLIDFDEIQDDGNVRDSIPPIYDPQFIAATTDTKTGPLEPVLSLELNGDARAYPISILLWHEIVNDEVGGVPVAITYCPLCNSGVVFDRRLNGQTLLLGNTGRIRNYDMIMFDHKSESWWQQFSGRAIIGDQTGNKMTLIAARVESLTSFINRFPEGKLLVPNDPNARPYGRTPFAGLERRISPFGGPPQNLPAGMGPFDYAIVIGDEAWPLNLLKSASAIEHNGLRLSWEPGRNSIHSTEQISDGSDLGNVVVTRQGIDVPHDVVFAFAFDSFVPNGTWHTTP